MDTDRRQVMTAMALAGAAAAGSGASAAAPAIQARLIHHVFFWLKNPGSAADRAALIEGLRTLGGIDVVRGLHIGTPAPTEQRGVVDSSYDVSELLFFDNVKDQKTYQDHPLHLAFVDKCEHLWSKVVVYDVASG